MRTRFALVALSLTALLLAPGALATGGPSPGPFTGTVAQGETDTHRFSTHGDNPCLDVWIPKLYVVSLAYAPGTDTLRLSAGGQAAVGQNGVATVSFVANYCTSFSILVDGVAVDREAAYAVTVESVFTGGGPVVEPAS